MLFPSLAQSLLSQGRAHKNLQLLIFLPLFNLSLSVWFIASEVCLFHLGEGKTGFCSEPAGLKCFLMICLKGTAYSAGRERTMSFHRFILFMPCLSHANVTQVNKKSCFRMMVLFTVVRGKKSYPNQPATLYQHSQSLYLIKTAGELKLAKIS